MTKHSDHTTSTYVFDETLPPSDRCPNSITDDEIEILNIQDTREHQVTFLMSLGFGLSIIYSHMGNLLTIDPGAAISM